MASKFERANSPTALAEVPFPNDDVKRVLYNYVNGTENRPLLMYGQHGVGKSMLANLLVSELSYGSGSAHLVHSDTFSDDYESLKRYFGLSNTLLKLCGNPNSHFHSYFICNEFRLPIKKDVATQNVKLLFDDITDEGETLLILTNNFDTYEQIHKAVLSRCCVLKVPPLLPSLMLPYAQKILEKHNLKVQDNTLLRALQHCYQRDNDGRRYYETLNRIINQ